MSRSASDPAAAPAQASDGGFTLIEVLIAMVAGVLLATGLVRFYKDSYRAYSMQDQIQERDQNAHFVVSRLTEILQQSGSGLPDTGWDMISQAGGITTIATNPRNAVQFVSYDLPSSQFVPVSDASLWKRVGNVLLNVRFALVDYADPAKTTEKFAIDTNYNASGFSKGVKDNASGMDSIRLAASVNLSVGDRIYGYRDDQYLLGGSSGTDLIIRPNASMEEQMVLAENIDSLAFTFKDAGGATVTSWKTMRSVSLAVRARNAIPDKRIPGLYRKLTLPMNIILRNRI
jgi:prepilin-type N-terminal cleavage/methylation domain-containing protein